MESLSYTWTFRLCRGFCCLVLRLVTKGCTPKKRTHSVKKPPNFYSLSSSNISIIAFFFLIFFLSEVIRRDDINSCSVEANKAVVPGVTTVKPVNACNTAPSQLYSGSFKQMEPGWCSSHRNVIHTRYYISCSKHSSLVLGCHVWLL